MLRAIVLFHMTNYDGTGAGTIPRTVDFDCPAPEELLDGKHGYSTAQVIGVEVIQTPTPGGRA